MANENVQLVINKNSEVSIHRQIVNQISTLIDSGVLKGGQRLPTERQLSEEYGIARGTVKAAYQELMRIGKANAVQGSGTYVRAARPSIARRNIRGLITNTLTIALNSGVSYDCVKDLLRQEYERIMMEGDTVRVCWVGVVREVLDVGAKLLSAVENVELTAYLREEVSADPSLMNHMDMIVTTENPYAEVLRLSGNQADKVLRLSVSVDEENIVDIARRSVDRRVLMCDTDSLYMEWICEMEGLLEKAVSVERIRADAPDLLSASERSDLLILPCREAFQDCEPMLALEKCFQDQGKPIIYAGFHFDRGSMINFQSNVLRIRAHKDSVRNVDNAQLRANYTL